MREAFEKAAPMRTSRRDVHRRRGADLPDVGEGATAARCRSSRSSRPSRTTTIRTSTSLTIPNTCAPDLPEALRTKCARWPSKPSACWVAGAGPARRDAARATASRCCWK
jgi:hypothetical protein